MISMGWAGEAEAPTAESQAHYQGFAFDMAMSLGGAVL